MLYGIVAGDAGDNDYVKLRLQGDGIVAHICVGCPDHAGAFAAVYGLCRVDECRAPCLDLDKADDVVARGDEIYLHASIACVLARDGIAPGQQMLAGHLLAPGAKLVMVGHRDRCPRRRRSRRIPSRGRRTRRRHRPSPPRHSIRRHPRVRGRSRI